MPGFLIGIEADDQGVPAPSKPIYSYTWNLESLAQSTQLAPFVYVKDLTLPEFGVDTEEVSGGSLKYKYAKGVTFSDVKITIWATSGLVAALEELKQKVWDPDLGLKPAANYKATSTINQYFADDITIAQAWTLNGSWIRNISHSNLTYASSDVHNVIVAVAYDWATVISY